MDWRVRKRNDKTYPTTKKKNRYPNLPSWWVLAVLCSYHISGYIRGSGLAMVQLECIAFPFPALDVFSIILLGMASRAFSGVRMRIYNGFFSTIKVLVVFGTVGVNYCCIFVEPWGKHIILSKMSRRDRMIFRRGRKNWWRRIRWVKPQWVSPSLIKPLTFPRNMNCRGILVERGLKVYERCFEKKELFSQSGIDLA